MRGRLSRPCLKAPTQAPAWPGCRRWSRAQVLPLPDGLTPIKALPSAHAPTRDFLIRCCNNLIAAEADLNALDARSGDGDTGTTLATAARALIGVPPTSLPLADRPSIKPRHRAGTKPDHGRIVCGSCRRSCLRRRVMRPQPA